MPGAHRQAGQDPVRSAAKSAWWITQGVGIVAVGLAILAVGLAVLGIPIYLIATSSKYQWLGIAGLQGLVTVELARQLAVKVLRNRAPSPKNLADWMGDAAVLIGFVFVVLVSIGEYEGWMHGAFSYATDSILGVLVVGLPVYWWRGKQRLVLALTARAIAGQWPWSATG